MSEKDNWELFDEFVKADDLPRAEILARKQDYEWLIAESLATVAMKYWNLPQTEKAVDLLNEAAEIAREGENSESLQDSLDSSSTLSEIAEYFALNGDFNRAKEIGNAIRNEWKSKRSLENLMNIENGEKGAFQKLRHNDGIE